jgi:hypothetical protein
MDIFKLVKRYWWRTILGLFPVLSWLGVEEAQNMKGAAEFFQKVDAWIIDSAAYPGLFAVSLALFLSLVFFPWLRDLINKELAIRALWKLRSDGISIRNDHRYVTDPNNYVAWLEKRREWRKSIKKEAKRISNHLHDWIDRLNLLEIEKMPEFKSSFENENFKLEYSCMTEELLRIERYLIEKKIFGND